MSIIYLHKKKKNDASGFEIKRETRKRIKEINFHWMGEGNNERNKNKKRNFHVEAKNGRRHTATFHQVNSGWKLCRATASISSGNNASVSNWPAQERSGWIEGEIKKFDRIARLIEHANGNMKIQMNGMQRKRYIKQGGKWIMEMKSGFEIRF